MNTQGELAQLVEKLRQEWHGLPAAERASLTALARRMSEALAASGDGYREAQRILHSLRRDPEWADDIARLQHAAASLLAGLDPYTLEELVDYLRGLGLARKEVR